MLVVLTEGRVTVFAQRHNDFVGPALVSVLCSPLGELKGERLFPVVSGLAVAIAEDRVPLDRVPLPRAANALRRLRGDAPIPAIWCIDAGRSLNPVDLGAHLTRDPRFFEERHHG
jgi:hypothetical protein